MSRVQTIRRMYQVRRTSLGLEHRGPPATPRGQERRRPEAPRVAGGQGASSPAPTCLPFSAASLLGLEAPGVQVAVLDGKVLQVCCRSPRDGEGPLLLNRRPVAVRSVIDLRERLTQVLALHYQWIYKWARYRSAQETQHLTFTVVRPDTAEAVNQFVHSTLIPRLRRETGGVSNMIPSAATAPSPSRSPQEQLTAIAEALAQVWPRWCAFYLGTWHHLAPYFGPSSVGQFCLGWQGQAYASMVGERKKPALERFDQTLKETLLRSFQPLMQCPQPEVLYQGGGYGLLHLSGGNHYLYRQIPAYVVEGQDRRLYLFEPVRVGVRIASTQVNQVVYSCSAMVSHEYRHMFVFGNGNGASICMPRPEGYYQELHRLPLEEALLKHLESARMTLCSGYHEGNPNTALHNICRLGKPQISEREAQLQGLPVYRYYRR